MDHSDNFDIRETVIIDCIAKFKPIHMRSEQVSESDMAILYLRH
jgi:hypothetical protein